MQSFTLTKYVGADKSNLAKLAAGECLNHKAGDFQALSLTGSAIEHKETR